MTLRHDGNISPCCYLYEDSVLKAGESSVMEAWNSEAMREFRIEQLSGVPKRCEVYTRSLSCEEDFEKWRSTTTLDIRRAAPPRRLDIRLSGECNLRCVMCDVWKHDKSPYTEENFWAHGPKEIFPFLEELDIVGGEPFVQEHTFRLIEEVGKVNPGVRFGFITNGQWEWAGRIEKALSSVRISFVQMSLDSLAPESYAKIRREGTLEKSLRALDALIELRKRKPFTLAVSQLLSSMNWRELGSFAAFAKARGLAPRWQLLREPAKISLKNADKNQRQEAGDYWSSCLAEFPEFPQIGALIRELQSP